MGAGLVGQLPGRRGDGSSRSWFRCRLNVLTQLSRLSGKYPPLWERDKPYFQATARTLPHGQQQLLGAKLKARAVYGNFRQVRLTDIGRPSRAFRVTPPGMRVRTKAVRRS